jgi:hypothetical protein
LTGEISEFNGLIDVVDVVYSRARIWELLVYRKTSKDRWKYQGTNSESKRNFSTIFDVRGERIRQTTVDEDLQTFSAKVKYFLTIVVFLFFTETVFWLSDLKLSVSFDCDQTHSKVGPTWILTF